MFFDVFFVAGCRDCLSGFPVCFHRVCSVGEVDKEAEPLPESWKSEIQGVLKPFQSK